MFFSRPRFLKSVRLAPVWVCAMLRFKCAAYSGLTVRHAPVYARAFDPSSCSTGCLEPMPGPRRFVVGDGPTDACLAGPQSGTEPLLARQYVVRMRQQSASTCFGEP